MGFAYDEESAREICSHMSNLYIMAQEAPENMHIS